jgi:hypothetical protein
MAFRSGDKRRRDRNNSSNNNNNNSDDTMDLNTMLFLVSPTLCIYIYIYMYALLANCRISLFYEYDKLRGDYVHWTRLTLAAAIEVRRIPVEEVLLSDALYQAPSRLSGFEPMPLAHSSSSTLSTCEKASESTCTRLPFGEVGEGGEGGRGKCGDDGAGWALLSLGCEARRKRRGAFGDGVRRSRCDDICDCDGVRGGIGDCGCDGGCGDGAAGNEVPVGEKLDCRDTDNDDADFDDHVESVMSEYTE